MFAYSLCMYSLLFMPNPVEFHLPDPDATEALGRALAALLRPGLLVTLQGPLGSGKTTLVRAMLRTLGHPGRVRSPSYTLVEPYELAFGMVCHFDFYRFADPGAPAARDADPDGGGAGREAEDAGFREHFDGHTLCLIEWPERAGAWLPPSDLSISWQEVASGRTVHIEARNPALHAGVCVLLRQAEQLA